MTTYINRSNDEEIINIIKSILDNGNFKVETMNESILVKLLELRGTPLNQYESTRDVDRDFEQWKSEDIQTNQI